MASDKQNGSTVILKISDMNCAACARTIDEALSSKDGVVKASINPSQKRATVDYEPGIISEKDMVKAVEEAGYNVDETKAADEE